MCQPVNCELANLYQIAVLQYACAQLALACANPFSTTKVLICIF